MKTRICEDGKTLNVPLKSSALCFIGTRRKGKKRKGGKKAHSRSFNSRCMMYLLSFRPKGWSKLSNEILASRPNYPACREYPSRHVFPYLQRFPWRTYLLICKFLGSALWKTKPVIHWHVICTCHAALINQLPNSQSEFDILSTRNVYYEMPVLEH